MLAFFFLCYNLIVMDMKLEDLLNLDGIEIEDKIVDSIDDVRVELRDLTTDLTCKIYSSYMREALGNRHLISRIVNTKELGLPYEHLFNVVVDGVDNYYLIDLTYKQFNNNEFIDLLLQGFMKINDETFNRYLEIVGKDKININIEDIFYNSKKR